MVEDIRKRNKIIEFIKLEIAQAKLDYLKFLCDKYGQKGGVWIPNLDYVHEFAVLEKELQSEVQDE